jgi:hypothetical protein
VISIVFCFLATPAVAYFFSETKETVLVPFLVAILFFPMAIQGISGLIAAYSPGHWWNSIYRGKAALIVNAAWLLSYVIIVVVAFVSQWK